MSLARAVVRESAAKDFGGSAACLCCNLQSTLGLTIRARCVFGKPQSDLAGVIEKGELVTGKLRYRFPYMVPTIRAYRVFVTGLGELPTQDVSSAHLLCNKRVHKALGPSHWCLCVIGRETNPRCA
jgi:hypothetical protein